MADLGDADPFVRAVAALALSEQAPERAGAAIDVLLETVDRTELGLQPPAARALAKIAPRVSAELVERLLTDEFMTAERRAVVLASLAAAGPEGAAAVVEAVRGPGRALAGELGVVLVRIGPASVAPLVGLLEEGSEPQLQGLAAFALGQLGPRARAALPALEAARSHPDSRVREAVIEALRAIQAGGPAASGPLVPSGEGN